jgi:hypothetical protein
MRPIHSDPDLWMRSECGRLQIAVSSQTVLAIPVGAIQAQT